MKHFTFTIIVMACIMAFSQTPSEEYVCDHSKALMELCIALDTIEDGDWIGVLVAIDGVPEPPQYTGEIDTNSALWDSITLAYRAERDQYFADIRYLVDSMFNTYDLRYIDSQDVRIMAEDVGSDFAYVFSAKRENVYELMTWDIIGVLEQAFPRHNFAIELKKYERTKLLSVYPNPAEIGTFLKIRNNAGSNLKISLFDISGGLLQTYESNKTNILNIPTINFTNQCIILKAVCEGGESYKKIYLIK